MVLFPVPAHRTGLADFPHPALGKDSRVRPRKARGPVWQLDQAKHGDDEVLAIGTIEHIDAIGSIREVVATPGLDLVFIGPGDLATSMGLRGRGDDPDVAAAIKALEEPIRNSPVILGGVATTPKQARDMIARGYRALVVGFDWSLFQRGLDLAIEGIH